MALTSKSYPPFVTIGSQATHLMPLLVALTWGLWLSPCLIHMQHMTLRSHSRFDFRSPLSSVSLTATEDETRTQILNIKKVTAEDLKRNYVCHARNAKGEVDKAAKVKQKGNGCTQQMSP